MVSQPPVPNSPSAQRPPRAYITNADDDTNTRDATGDDDPSPCFLPSRPSTASGSAGGDGTPSPSALTSVHPDEITVVGFAPPFPYPPTGDDTTALHETFRHSWWQLRRERVRDALVRQDTRTETLRRFGRCGETAWLLRDTNDPDRYRLATNRCRHRWCEACSRDRQRIIVANLRTVMDGHTLRLLTLTLASQPLPLEWQVRRLYDAFRVFRRRPLVKNRMTGGVYFLEVTFNERTDRWHPHLHVVFEGGYLPHEVAKATWLDVTEDSYIVDVRPLNGAGGAASYVAKYATKAVGASVWTHPRLLDEAMRALTGRRCFQVFGDWRGLHLSKPPDDNTIWEAVCTLADLIRRAQTGDQESRRILCEIANRTDLTPLDLPEPLGDSS